MKQIELSKRAFSLKRLISCCFVLLMIVTGFNAYADDNSKLKIVDENGNTILVDAESTNKIEDIKKKIKDVTGICVDEQYLYLNGTLLEDGNTLQDYSVQIKDNEIDLIQKHKWQYEKYVRSDQETDFFAYCLNKDCKYSKKPEENLIAAFHTDAGDGYTGQPFKYVCFDNGITNVTGDKPSPIYYEGRDGTVYEKSTDAPIDAGEYTASVSLGGLTATVKFLIDKNPRYDSPDVDGIGETIKNKNDGKLINVDSSMEYRKDGEDKYISIDGNTVEGLTPGKYFVRYKDSTNYYASKECVVIIDSSSNLISVSVPSEQIGYELSASNSNVEYGGSSELTFKLKDGYSKNGQFVINVNGSSIKLDEDDKYTIKDIKEDLVIKVEGVVETEVTNDIQDISDTIPDYIKNQMRQYAKNNGLTMGNQFLDICMYKGGVKLSNTVDKIKVTIPVSDDLINSNANRTYYVIRYHDGDISHIEGIFDSNSKSFTFESDKFSLYVIAYKDTKKGSTNKVVNLSCEELMNSKNWTWSETKKACVYRVSNTSTK